MSKKIKIKTCKKCEKVNVCYRHRTLCKLTWDIMGIINKSNDTTSIYCGYELRETEEMFKEIYDMIVWSRKTLAESCKHYKQKK